MNSKFTNSLLILISIFQTGRQEDQIQQISEICQAFKSQIIQKNARQFKNLSDIYIYNDKSKTQMIDKGIEEEQINETKSIVQIKSGSQQIIIQKFELLQTKQKERDKKIIEYLLLSPKNENYLGQKVVDCQIYGNNVFIQFFPFYKTIRQVFQQGERGKMIFFKRLEAYISFYQKVIFYHQKKIIFRSFDIDNLSIHLETSSNLKPKILINDFSKVKQASSLSFAKENENLLPFDLRDSQSQNQISIIDDLWNFVLVISYIEIDKSIINILKEQIAAQEKIFKIINQLKQRSIEFFNEPKNINFYQNNNCNQDGFQSLYELLIQTLEVGKGNNSSDEQFIEGLKRTLDICKNKTFNQVPKFIKKNVSHKISKKQLKQELGQIYQEQEWQNLQKGKQIQQMSTSSVQNQLEEQITQQQNLNHLRPNKYFPLLLDEINKSEYQQDEQINQKDLNHLKPNKYFPLLLDVVNNFEYYQDEQSNQQDLNHLRPNKYFPLLLDVINNPEQNKFKQNKRNQKYWIKMKKK